MKSQIMSRLHGLSGGRRLGTAEYTDWIDENHPGRKIAMSATGRSSMNCMSEGPDALRLFSTSASIRSRLFALGQAKHVIACNTAGKVIGEGILMRLDEQKFEFQALGPVTDWFEYNCKRRAATPLAPRSVAPSSKFQVSGPKALYLLEELTTQDLRDIKFMHVKTWT